MKMELLQWKFEFDKDDAKIVIPVLLLLLALTLTPLNKVALWSGAGRVLRLVFFLKTVHFCVEGLVLEVSLPVFALQKPRHHFARNE